MNNDRELLELAANAVGTPHWDESNNCFGLNGFYWNPLESDGDALRLAVKLGIGLSFGIQEGRVVATGADSVFGEWEHITPDTFAATRRAITRAAAEIGKSMP